MFKILRKVLPVLLLGLLFIFPIVNTPAYADGGAHGSTGHGGGGFGGDGTHNTANKARAMYWQIFTAENTNYVEDWDWENMVKDHPDVICTFLTDGRSSSKTPGVDRCYGWDKFFADWEVGSEASDVFEDMYNNEKPEAAFLEEAHHKGYADDVWIDDPTRNGVQCGFHWWRRLSDMNILDRIWAYKNQIIEKVEKNSEISYVNGGLGEQLDHRDWSAYNQYWYGRKTPVDYWFKTDPNETVARKHLDAETLTAVRHEKCSKGKCTVWYTIENRLQYTKDFTYNTITPTIKKEPFKPWNLNRNGYATIDDISSQYAHAKLPIELDVNNNQGIYDNSPLKALDINNDTFFKFKFTNGYLGMPSVFNWTNPPGTPPGILNNGSWEDAGRGGYANGRNANADKDGLYRYNVKLHMSMSPNTKKPFVDTSSINFNGSEFTTSEEALQRPPWAGGNMSTRFTYADTYWTDNDYGSSSFPAWWVNTYTMGRFYEYGSEWRGIVGLDGIHDPNDVRYGTGKSLGGDRYKITIDANKQQKGLYVGYASANFEQPIITGTWEVKTLSLIHI